MSPKQKRLTKHDRYVLELRNKIKHKYDFIETKIIIIKEWIMGYENVQKMFIDVSLIHTNYGKLF